MPILALYDTMSIQNYIFSSNKLKENIGASILAAKIFREFLKESIKEISSNCEVNWENQKNFLIKGNNSIDAEIIYIGGGNALVAFKNKDIAKKVTQELSKKILEKAKGLTFAVSYKETDFKTNFQEDIEELHKKLEEKKQSYINTYPLLGIGITKQGVTDGLPASCNEEKEERRNIYISQEAYLKRKELREFESYFEKRFSLKRDIVFPKNIDKLGQKKGENFIGVVHIDGNSMGKQIKKVIEESKNNYEGAIYNIRILSKKITSTYEEAFKEIIRELQEFMKTKEYKDNFEYRIENEKEFLPIRPLIFEGDDVTWVCPAKLALPLTKKFLQKIDGQKIEISNDITLKLSACAGVSIVKSHFPFYRAYDIAEQLCSSAKLKAKILAKNEDYIGSWLDFHITYSGITGELDKIRTSYYNVPGMNQPTPLKRGFKKYTQYNLLWRPWCISNNSENEYKWENLKEIINNFLKHWSKNKLKQLRNICIKGKEEIELLIKEYKSRGLKLPKFNNNDKFFIDEIHTPYFDALELIDIWIDF